MAKRKHTCGKQSLRNGSRHNTITISRNQYDHLLHAAVLLGFARIYLNTVDSSSTYADIGPLRMMFSVMDDEMKH